MPRMGLTYEAVKDAAERLEGQNLPPTVMRVRNEVGGTGSLTTIARHLKEWRRAADGAASDLASSSGAAALVLADASVGMPAPVAEVARTAWQQLHGLAAAEVERTQLACADRIEAAAEEAAERCRRAEADAQKIVEAAVHKQELSAAMAGEARAAAERAEARVETLGAELAERAQAYGAIDGALRSLQQEAKAREEELRARLSRSEIVGQQAIEARDTAVARQRSSEAQCQARLDKVVHSEQQKVLGISRAFERTLQEQRQSAERDRQQEAARYKEQQTQLAALSSAVHTLDAERAEGRRLQANLERSQAQLAEQLLAARSELKGLHRACEILQQQSQRSHEAMAKLMELVRSSQPSRSSPGDGRTRTDAQPAADKTVRRN